MSFQKETKEIKKDEFEKELGRAINTVMKNMMANNILESKIDLDFDEINFEIKLKKKQKLILVPE